jgi:hypothetical protein
MEYFQYIFELYDRAQEQSIEDIVAEVEAWLLKNVGEENNTHSARHVETWGWSLTHYASKYRPSPVGVYFARREDRMAFILTFGLVARR